jgi:hypothetical protein
MTYRANVTDNEQATIEAANNDSAIPVRSNQQENQTIGKTKMVPAYGVGEPANAENGTGTTSAIRAIPGSGAVIGSHNDKPHRFATPGKA